MHIKKSNKKSRILHYLIRIVIRIFKSWTLIFDITTMLNDYLKSRDLCRFYLLKPNSCIDFKH